MIHNLSPANEVMTFQGPQDNLAINILRILGRVRK
jgi:hypothetical protein